MPGMRKAAAGIVAPALLALMLAGVVAAQPEPPALTGPVSDFAGVIDAPSREAIAAISAALQQATGDVIVVATVPTVAPAGIEEYALRMFENAGRGLGQRGQDNGALVLLAVEDREVRVEVGYGLEPYLTDGFVGQTSRQVMVPEFREGRYGAGLRGGVEQLAARVAEAKNVTLEGVPKASPRPVGDREQTPWRLILPIGWVLFLLFSSFLRRRRFRGRRRWGGHWSGWSSGVGPFGGGFGGGFGAGPGRGGGFGGGFGGFGGGRSGGGGGGASW